METGKIFVICLIAALFLVLTGCSETKNEDSLNSSENTTISEETSGIELPDEQFVSSDDKNESKDSVTGEKDEGDNSSSEAGSSYDSSTDNDQTSSESGDNTSSDVASSKPDDGSVELPFDKW